MGNKKLKKGFQPDISFLDSVYSCFEKGCPTEKHQSVRDNTERHDGLWLLTAVASSSLVHEFSARWKAVL